MEKVSLAYLDVAKSSRKSTTSELFPIEKFLHTAIVNKVKETVTTLPLDQS